MRGGGGKGAALTPWPPSRHGQGEQNGRSVERPYRRTDKPMPTYPRMEAYGAAVFREPVRRSWLIVPVLDDDAIQRAVATRADVIVLDMEDSIHDSRKPLARERARQVVERVAATQAEVFVRPDIELMYADLNAAVWPGLVGVVLPKVASPAQVREADAIIEVLERRRGLPDVIELCLCLETAPGNQEASEAMRASKRVRFASLGRADLVMDLRPEPSGELHMMPYLMERLVMIAKAAGVEPIGAWWTGDSRGMRASPEATARAAGRARRTGFTGALCVDPAQVAPLNRGFTPTAEEVAWAKAAHGSADGVEGEVARRVVECRRQCEERDRPHPRLA